MKTASGVQREGEEEEGDAEETVEGGRGGREGETEAEAETETEDETRGSVGVRGNVDESEEPVFFSLLGYYIHFKPPFSNRCEKKAGWPLRLRMERIELLKSTLL